MYTFKKNIRRWGVFAIVGVHIIFCAQGVYAIENDGKYGLETVAGAAGLTSAGTDVPKILGGLVGTGLSLISVLFFVLILYGGITWMTAHGDDTKTQKSRQIIFAASIGIIIVLSAYMITNFILSSAGAGGSGAGGGGAGGAGDASAWCLSSDGTACAEKDTCAAGETAYPEKECGEIATCVVGGDLLADCKTFY